MLWIILSVLLYFTFRPVYRKIKILKQLKSITSFNRGNRSERDVIVRLLQMGLPAEAIFHDLYVIKNGTEFSQIDVLVVAKVGLIVIEVKDYRGWIFGNGKQSYWTQTLAKDKIYKNKFYNPIKQNAGHIKALRDQLNLDTNVPIFSVISFSGKCVLKEINFVPAETYVAKSSRLHEVIKLILRNNPPAFYQNIDEVLRVIRSSVNHGNDRVNQSRHNENIRDMLGKDRVFH